MRTTIPVVTLTPMPQGKLRCIMSTPNLKTYVEPVTLDDDHAFLRPFHVALKDGKPPRARVHFVLLDPRRYGPHRVLTAATIAAPQMAPAFTPRFVAGRLLIFPAWGSAKFSHAASSGGPPSIIHHVTVEEKASGVVTFHLSAPRIAGVKPKFADTTAVPLPGGHGVHLFTLVIRRPEDLDVAGHAWSVYDDLPHQPRAALEATLQALVEHEQPIIGMPHDEPWREGYHLQAHFILTDAPMKDADYPMLHVTDASVFPGGITVPTDYKIRQTTIPLEGNTRLVIVLNQLEGVPSRPFTFKNARLAPRKTAL